MRKLGLAILLMFEFILLFVGSTNLVIYLSAHPYLYEEATEVPRAYAVLIPGASLTKEGKPAPIFTDRINTAIELYQSGKVEKFLVSGDDSTTGHNEVDPARLYLLQQGIPDTDIVLDHAGFDTYSTMYRAKAIFNVPSIVITSQSFHLPRAIFLARKLGIEAYGLNADEGHILSENYYREALANVKAILDLAMKREPQFLGASIPITASSSAGY